MRVRVVDGDGNPEDVLLAVIDWANPEANDFFLVQQFWVPGDMYRRRCDLVGFVNGIPLLLIELKQPSVAVKSAFDDNLADYKVAVPQLFVPNALVMLSNGSDTRIASLTAAWEHCFEWKRINDEGEQGVVSLETAVRGLCDKTRLLDLVENFTRPEPPLTEAEREAVKKVARELLAKLKAERLVIDWRQKLQARAAVRQTIAEFYRRLPSPAYGQELIQQKREQTFGHLYDSYAGARP